ncbi:MAG: hypothetical protein ACE5G1_17595, partial [bacterium]
DTPRIWLVLARITPQKIDRLTIDTNIVGGKKSFALGLESKINIHFNRYIALTAGDAYLLCTEELHDLEPDLVKQIVSHDSPHHAGQKLFDLVAEKSSKDTLDLQMITINLPLHQSTGGVSPRIWPRKRIWLSATLLFLLTATTTLMLSDKRIVHETEAKKPSPPPMSPSQTPQIVIENSPAKLVEEDNPDSVIFAKIKAEQTAAKPSPKIARASKPLDQPAKQPSTTGKTTESIIEPFSAMWNLQNLTEVDYRVSPEKIIFLPTPNLKKALYRSEPLSNFSINVEARIHNTAAGRFGIMVGYRAMGNSPYEVYYLLSLFRQKEFLLQKYSGFRKELVTRIPIAREVLTNNYQTMKIKVTCSGPFIELTANQRQIFRWRTGEEVVKGNIGIFVSPDTEVELSRFEVSDSSDLTRK